MSTQGIVHDQRSAPNRTVDAPRPQETEAAKRLNTRVLTLASTEAEQTAPHIDPDVGGLVVPGAKALRTVRRLRERHSGLLLLIEPTSTSSWATPDAPFVLQDDTDGLFDITLDQALDAQLDAGADIAVTPTGVFDAGDSSAMKAALKQANELDRRDVLFLFPVHYRWLTEENIKQLIAIISRSRHPIGLALADSNTNPLDHKGVIPNYRRLFEQTPWAMPWRTDLAAFDALSHGARAAAIGQLPSLRRVAFPDKGGFSSDKTDKTPAVLLPQLLRYCRSSKMQQEWFASASPDTCACYHCNGLAIDRFNGSDKHRLQAHLHNLLATTTMRHEIDGFTPPQIAAWWHGRLIDVAYQRQALTGRIGVEVGTTRDVESWLNES